MAGVQQPSSSVMHPHKHISAEIQEVGEKEQDCLPPTAAWRTSQTSCKDTSVNFRTCLYLAVSAQLVTVSGWLFKALDLLVKIFRWFVLFILKKWMLLWMFSISKVYWHFSLLAADHLPNMWWNCKHLFMEFSELQKGRSYQGCLLFCLYWQQMEKHMMIVQLLLCTKIEK